MPIDAPTIKHLNYIVENGNVKNGNVKKCEYDKGPDLTIVLQAKNGGCVYVNSYECKNASDMFSNLFSEKPDLITIIIEDFTADDIKEWLRRWHRVPGYQLERYPPKKNIGIYMLLCQNFGMFDMIKHAMLSLRYMDMMENLDLISIVHTSIVNKNPLFMSVIVFKTLAKWIRSRKLPKKSICSLSSEFLYMCLVVPDHFNSEGSRTTK
jgi:hypothetical protein